MTKAIEMPSEPETTVIVPNVPLNTSFYVYKTASKNISQNTFIGIFTATGEQKDREFKGQNQPTTAIVAQNKKGNNNYPKPAAIKEAKQFGDKGYYFTY